jgi:hypothetical protein
MALLESITARDESKKYSRRFKIVRDEWFAVLFGLKKNNLESFASKGRFEMSRARFIANNYRFIAVLSGFKKYGGRFKMSRGPSRIVS